MDTWEKQKRIILPYLQRAEEIDKVDDKVAYYCRLYAVDQGINMADRHPKADELLGQVLTQLEKTKPGDVNHDEDKKHCERFALKVFHKAQKKDVERIVDRDTAKAYYAAFNFLEILKQFGELAGELERLRRFAVYRASEIKKALDEGRDPKPIKPVDEPPTPQIDFDPGYQPGLRVLYTEDGVSPGKPATVKTLHANGQDTLEIELDSGEVLEVLPASLAPELPLGSEVTYYSPDGFQHEGMVEEMDKEVWPPIFTLNLEDGSTAYVKHSEFTLTSVPQAPISDASVPLPPSLPAAEPVPLNGIAMDSTKAFPGLESENGSFITRPPESDCTPIYESMSPHPGPFPIGNHPPTDMPRNGGASTAASDASIPQNSEHSGTPASVPPPAYVPSPLAPTSPPGPMVGVEHHPQPPVSITSSVETQPQNRENTGPPVPASLDFQFRRPPGFQPGLQAIEDAKKCAKYANTSLNFSDVDNAIVYLTDALKLLTGQSER